MRESLCYTRKQTHDDQTYTKSWVCFYHYGEGLYYMWKCHKCQVYGDKINALLVPLFNMMSPWTFVIWGIDIIGPINRKANNIDSS